MSIYVGNTNNKAKAAKCIYVGGSGDFPTYEETTEDFSSCSDSSSFESKIKGFFEISGKCTWRTYAQYQYYPECYVAGSYKAISMHLLLASREGLTTEDLTLKAKGDFVLDAHLFHGIDSCLSISNNTYIERATGEVEVLCDATSEETIEIYDGEIQLHSGDSIILKGATLSGPRSTVEIAIRSVTSRQQTGTEHKDNVAVKAKSAYIGVGGVAKKFL